MSADLLDVIVAQQLLEQQRLMLDQQLTLLERQELILDQQQKLQQQLEQHQQQHADFQHELDGALRLQLESAQALQQWHEHIKDELDKTIAVGQHGVHSELKLLNLKHEALVPPIQELLRTVSTALPLLRQEHQPRHPLQPLQQQPQPLQQQQLAPQHWGEVPQPQHWGEPQQQQPQPLQQQQPQPLQQQGRWGEATAPQASQQQQQPPPPQLQQRHAPPYVAQEHTYQVSEAVEAQWRHPDGSGWAKSNNWWPAVVRCVNDDGTYSIEFENHYGRLTSVPANRMRPPRFSRVAPPPVSPLPHPPQTGPRGLHSYHVL